MFRGRVGFEIQRHENIGSIAAVERDHLGFTEEQVVIGNLDGTLIGILLALIHTVGIGAFAGVIRPHTGGGGSRSDFLMQDKFIGLEVIVRNAFRLNIVPASVNAPFVFRGGKQMVGKFTGIGVMLVFGFKIQVFRADRRHQVTGGSIHLTGGKIDQIQFGITESEGDRAVGFRGIILRVVLGVADQDRVVNAVRKGAVGLPDLQLDHRGILAGIFIVNGVQIRFSVHHAVIDFIVVIGIIRLRIRILSAKVTTAAHAGNHGFIARKHSGGKGQLHKDAAALFMLTFYIRL